MKRNVYNMALRALIGVKRRRLNVVVVGANDGRINDPIYSLAMRKSNKTNVLLIEPNSALLPHLESNYSTHPSHQICNCAIGQEGTLTLYAIKREWWDDFQPAYAKGWPSYRAPTGISSSMKSHVERALRREGLHDPEEMIETLTAPSKELKTLLAELGWSSPIDVLQIDAEGCDDMVIYASNLEYTRPRLIYFESAVVSKDRLESLLKYLSEHHYKTHRINTGNCLSVDRRIDPTGVFLRGMILILRVLRRLFAASRHGANRG